MVQEILKVRGVKKYFGGVMAVDGASFSVEEQTIRGLIGANGVGKTTLFNLITGYYKLDSGKILGPVFTRAQYSFPTES